MARSTSLAFLALAIAITVLVSSAPNRKTVRRLQAELKALAKYTPPNITLALVSEENLFLWRATYLKNGAEQVMHLTVPANYPISPPTVRPYVCVNILNVAWSPALRLVDVILSKIFLRLLQPIHLPSLSA